MRTVPTIFRSIVPALFLGFSSISFAATCPESWDLSDYRSGSCDAQWADDCLDGWGSFGANDSVDTVVHSTLSGQYGVMMDPGSVYPNGITRLYNVSAGDDLEFEERFAVSDSEASLVVRAKFRDSSNTVLSTDTWSFKRSAGITTAKVRFVVPSNATTVEYQVGALASSNTTGGTRVTLMMGGCRSALKPPVELDDLCLDWTPCECNISCPEGSTLVEFCTPDEATCTMISDCYCEDDSSGDDTQGLMDPSNWQ